MHYKKTKNPDSSTIRNMFDRLAPRYDLFNHLTSFGRATVWRRHTLAVLKPGMRVLDLGCGTGDLALEAADLLRGRGEVVGLDFSPQMLAYAEKRSGRMRFRPEHAPRFLLRRAEELPVETEPYDVVVSGFVLRNLYEKIDQILRGVFRSLKPGGKISFLDITEPQNVVARGLWKLYMSTLAVLYGKAVFGRDYPAFYLTQSANRFLNRPQFLQKLSEVGFVDVRSRSFMFGAITLYQAAKPVSAN